MDSSRKMIASSGVETEIRALGTRFVATFRFREICDVDYNLSSKITTPEWWHQSGGTRAVAPEWRHQSGALRIEGCEPSLMSTVASCGRAPAWCPAHRRVRILVDVAVWKLRSGTRVRHSLKGTCNGCEREVGKCSCAKGNAP